MQSGHGATCTLWWLPGNSTAFYGVPATSSVVGPGLPLCKVVELAACWVGSRQGCTGFPCVWCRPLRLTYHMADALIFTSLIMSFACDMPELRTVAKVPRLANSLRGSPIYPYRPDSKGLLGGSYEISVACADVISSTAAWGLKCLSYDFKEARISCFVTEVSRS